MNKLIELLEKYKKDWEAALPKRIALNSRCIDLFERIQTMLAPAVERGLARITSTPSGDPARYIWSGPEMTIDFDFDRVSLALRTKEYAETTVSIFGRYAGYLLKLRDGKWYEHNSGRELTEDTLALIIISIIFDREVDLHSA